MKSRLLSSMLFAAVVAGCTAPPEPAAAPPSGAVLSAVPARPDPTGRYVIYLHGIGLDGEPDGPARARFAQLVEALADTGATVIAEIRGPGTIRKSPEDLDLYARKVASQVQQLLEAGVPARRIHVIGFSRGGVIAQMASGYIARPEVGFGILAGCVSAQGGVSQFAPVLMRYADRLQGDFLSVIEESDRDFGSCVPYFSRAARLSASREATVRTGRGHLLFAQPHEAWLTHVAQWLRAR